MATYLLAWNPKRYPWQTFEEDVQTIRETGSLSMNWSCGNTKRILEGDRAFMIRQGKVEPGLIASGIVTSVPYEEDHWEDAGSHLSRKALYVDVELDFLAEHSVISRDELRSSPFDQVNWGTQASGISINAVVARALEQEWGRRTRSFFELASEEVADSDYPEGASSRISVNAYERNTQARAACIAHYGSRCCACGLDFGERYGPLARGIIHVHHLLPLSELGREYLVNPIADLRPLCPNCHAVVHRQEPPIDVEELKALLRQHVES